MPKFLFAAHLYVNLTVEAETEEAAYEAATSLSVAAWVAQTDIGANPVDDIDLIEVMEDTNSDS